jgi:hypothetical protein
MNPFSFRNHALRILTSASFTLAVLALSGCSPAITLKINPSSRDGATFEASLTPTAEALVRKLSDKNDGSGADTAQAGAPASIYDREAILVSLGNAGLRADSLEFPGKTGIRLALTLVKSDGFLGNALSVSKENRKMTVTISRDTLARALELMPTDTRDYLDLFMAPAFTGETMTVPEYRDVVAAAYGKTLASELSASAFILTVKCPATVTAASVSAPGTVTKASNAAVFRLPLTTLLVLDTPVVAEVSW